MVIKQWTNYCWGSGIMHGKQGTRYKSHFPEIPGQPKEKEILKSLTG
jgi:hypothetical protein